ncbi:hypothetical protein [Streptomyces sp. NPDC001809]
MTVTRPARLAGAALCAVLALTCAGWILKDLAALGSPVDLAWHWAGDQHLPVRGRPATSLVDAVLLVASAAAAVAALRSRHAASAFAAAGTVTLALRLPGLWEPDSGALLTALVELALAAALVVTAAVGRRTAAAPHDPLPGRPRPGPAVAAGALLATGAVVLALWELYWAAELPLEATVDRFTGGRSIMKSALAPPPAWLSLTLVALYGTGAVSVLLRARHSRATGLLAGAFLAAGGLAAVARTTRYEMIGHFADLPAHGRLTVLTALFGLLGGLAVLVLLAGRGAPAGAPGARPPAGTPAPAPPHPPPPGW